MASQEVGFNWKVWMDSVTAPLASVQLFQGGRPVQILTPNRVRKILGVWGEGGVVGGGVSEGAAGGGG